uniref:Uncharacterized protein n=1 Tax=Rhizophora mucronata TaxID=61149 RepID=A0A2P2NBR5_RHIMU
MKGGGIVCTDMLCFCNEFTSLIYAIHENR